MSQLHGVAMAMYNVQTDMFGSIQCSGFSIFFFWPNQIHKIYSCLNQCQGCMFYKKFLVMIFRYWNTLSHTQENILKIHLYNRKNKIRRLERRFVLLLVSTPVQQEPVEALVWTGAPAVRSRVTIRILKRGRLLMTCQGMRGATLEDVLRTLWWGSRPEVITLLGPVLTPSVTVTSEEEEEEEGFWGITREVEVEVLSGITREERNFRSKISISDSENVQFDICWWLIWLVLPLFL